MAEPELLEVTITHNLLNDAEVTELFRRQLIALDWDRKGPDPNAYTGRAKTDVNLFHTMQQNGAAVIAAYKKATASPSDRLLGCVEGGAEFESVNCAATIAPDNQPTCSNDTTNPLPVLYRS